MPPPKARAPRNRTLTLEATEVEGLATRLLEIDAQVPVEAVLDRTIRGDCLTVLPLLPQRCVDLLVVDPPYNLTKVYESSTYSARPSVEYEHWLDSWLSLAVPLLKRTASVYVCSDWRSSSAAQRALERHLRVRNRITWEREKGRGALRNWKSVSEDIWFCTVSDEYFFNPDAVKLKRRVVAPYRDSGGRPRGWQESAAGAFRMTHPSNLWTDLSVPFWSMPENTDHPTQKPEKLIAKMLLASSSPGALVLDPFLGSGTTSVVAKKLGRKFIGIERELAYCLWAEKRLERAANDREIQGYVEGQFLERNTLALQQQQQQQRSTHRASRSHPQPPAGLE